MGAPYLQMRIWSLFPSSSKFEICNEEPKKRQKPERKLHYNPLLNILILENVFKNFNTNELLKLRQVCGLWDSEICKKLKRDEIQCKRICNDRDAKGFIKTCINSTNFPVQKFTVTIPYMSQMFCHLFQNIFSQQQIVILKVSVYSCDFPDVLNNITNLSNLRHLTVCRIPEESIHCVFITRTCANHISLSTAASIPFKSRLKNLETLIFRNSNPHKKFIGNYSPFIINFLKSCENLKNLEFYHWSSSLTSIFREASLRKLNSLIIQGKTLGYIDVALLQKKNLKNIKKIVITVGTYVTDEMSKDLLDSFRPALQEYVINLSRT